MSYKQFIPDIGEEWNNYWKKSSVQKEIELTKTDGLLSIFSDHLSRKGKILEAGCGLGKWVIVLSEKGYDIQGIDNNNYVINTLKKKFPKLKVKKGDVLKLPFKEKQFDAYLSFGVVEHFEEGPNKALKESYRVLKKNGTAIVEVPFDSPLRIITRVYHITRTFLKTPLRSFAETTGFRKKRKKFKKKFYEYRYSKNELRRFMKEAGYIDIIIFPKDDLSYQRSIALWLDYPKLQKDGGKIFELNSTGKLIKNILHSISPFTYSALIVAVAKKK